MSIIQQDIRNFNQVSDIKEICSFKPDIVIGSLPCQGFSIAGPAQKDPKDPWNSLFTNFARCQ
jgi:DNA (cytosine-5)-methyltransferase 1